MTSAKVVKMSVLNTNGAKIWLKNGRELSLLSVPLQAQIGRQTIQTDQIVLIDIVL